MLENNCITILNTLSLQIYVPKRYHMSQCDFYTSASNHQSMVVSSLSIITFKLVSSSKRQVKKYMVLSCAFHEGDCKA